MVLATNPDSNVSGLGHHQPKRLYNQTDAKALALTQPK